MKTFPTSAIPADELAAAIHTAINGDTTTLYYQGDTLPAYVESPPGLPNITPRQIRLALHGAGLLEALEAAVTAAGGEALITWGHATEYERAHQMIATLAPALGLTDAQIDALWMTAHTL